LTEVFRGPATGRLILPRLPDVIQRLAELERRVSDLERLLANVTSGAGLKCVECGREQADDERGWRSYLTVDDADDEEPVEAVVYCPDCAAREFGRRR
jgi:hypothetical protein